MEEDLHGPSNVRGLSMNVFPRGTRKFVLPLFPPLHTNFHALRNACNIFIQIQIYKYDHVYFMDIYINAKIVVFDNKKKMLYIP